MVNPVIIKAMKWRSLALALSLTCAVLAADTATVPRENFSVVDQIVAKVNGDIVSLSELLKTAQDTADGLRQQGLQGDRLRQAYDEREKDFLRNRIDQLLLTQRAKELDINVDSEVSKYLADLQRQMKIADPD